MWQRGFNFQIADEHDERRYDLSACVLPSPLPPNVESSLLGGCACARSLHYSGGARFATHRWGNREEEMEVCSAIDEWLHVCVRRFASEQTKNERTKK